MIKVAKKVIIREAFNSNCGPIVISIANQNPSTPILIKFKKKPLINKEK